MKSQLKRIHLIYMREFPKPEPYPIPKNPNHIQFPKPSLKEFIEYICSVFFVKEQVAHRNFNNPPTFANNPIYL